MSRFLSFVCCFALLTSVDAAASLTALEQNIKLRQLGTNADWLNLGHYRSNRLTSGYTSQADDARFFLAEDGVSNPESELIASLHAFALPDVGNGDTHAQCRFPARFYWLNQQLQLTSSGVTAVPCPAFATWREQHPATKATLVFAASYLNSPSSMFGHTLLRVDPPNTGKDKLLLATTISYAADAAEHENELTFAYRGIFGGYPGITAIAPYYDRINMYTDLEDRDLWEYELNLSPTEIDQLMRHAWEIKDIRFDYYFFDENCAYRLLALIDVARPGSHLTDETGLDAIPSDTVRWVVDKDLVANVEYRPSASTSVAFRLTQLTADERRAVAAITIERQPIDEAIQGRDAPSQARILDVAYDYVRFLSLDKKMLRDDTAALSHALLVKRASLSAVNDTLAPVPIPATRDDEGHDTLRISVSGGQDNHDHIEQLTLRPAYHDLLDPVDGYRHGASLEFFRWDLRYNNDDQSLDIDQFVGVGIRSLSAVTTFFQPLSWQVSVGARRTLAESDDKDVLVPYLDGGAGYATDLGPLRVFALATADTEVSSRIAKGYDLAPGASVGALVQQSRFNLLLQADTKQWFAESLDSEDILSARGAVHLTKQLSLFVDWERRRRDEIYQTEWLTGVHVYF